MTMIDVIPQEFFDGVPVPPVVTLGGELLGALEDVPAGAWLAEMIEGVDVGSLTTFELASYLRQCARAQAWLASCLDTGVAELASRRDRDVAADVEVETNLGPFDRPWSSKSTILRGPTPTRLNFGRGSTLSGQRSSWTVCPHRTEARLPDSAPKNVARKCRSTGLASLARPEAPAPNPSSATSASRDDYTGRSLRRERQSWIRTWTPPRRPQG